MTNFLQQAINCDNGGHAAKLIRDALERRRLLFPKQRPNDRERRARSAYRSGCSSLRRPAGGR
jgi:hypothetical protein